MQIATPAPPFAWPGRIPPATEPPPKSVRDLPGNHITMGVACVLTTAAVGDGADAGVAPGHVEVEVLRRAAFCVDINRAGPGVAVCSIPLGVLEELGPGKAPLPGGDDSLGAPVRGLAAAGVSELCSVGARRLAGYAVALLGTDIAAVVEP